MARPVELHRHVGGDRRCGGEYLGRIAGEPVGHHAAIGDPGDVESRAIDGVQRRELPGQGAQEPDIIDCGIRGRTVGAASVVPAKIDAVRIDDDGAVAVRDAVETAPCEPLHAATGSAAAVQHQDDGQRLGVFGRDVDPQGSLLAVVHQ
ncbi:MAG TPA: hypothetical protein VEH00_05365 [Steroidobacteraceae bacterium]|nr:hypothetical protein [Steroidobacteraceae bacterium]